MRLVTSVLRMTSTIIDCANGSSRDSDQLGKNNVYCTGHRTICLVVRIELCIVSMPATGLSAAPRDSSGRHRYPPLRRGTMQHDRCRLLKA